MIKTIINLFSLFSLFVIVVYPVSFIYDYVKARKVGASLPSIAEYLFGKEPQIVSSIVYSLIFVVGIANIVAEHCFSSTVLGSFYEKSDFHEYYEAVLTISEDTSFFCIVELEKETDPDPEWGVSYRIMSIQLPYGKMSYPKQEYDPDSNRNTVSVGPDGWRCDIVIRNPATEDSYTLLENAIVSNYGEFCGSKYSDIFHLLDCPHAQKISRENLVYFQSEKIASILGYTMCASCQDRY